ncbi:undecaprenyl-phosphate alpha-N-acetylglucosaminyl 1-phosphate transferase [Nitrospira sp.]|nr:undecaprenyl-phosphate alpha-N-acetylglucosaminyl 1-phosphate transferase [Nitrospira sp.]
MKSLSSDPAPIEGYLEAGAAPLKRLAWTSALGTLLLTGLLIPHVRDVFVAGGQRWAYILAIACVSSWTLTPWVSELGHRWGLVDVPNARKIHQTVTPRVGGLAIYPAFVLAILMNSIVTGWMVAMMVAATALFAIGVMDDAREVSATTKLVVHIAAASLVIASGKVLTLFPDTPLGETLNVLLTLTWIVGITSAFNFFDGMDGLATGLAILIAGFMGIVAFDMDQAGLGWVTVALIGACLGFLPYNLRFTKPARVFLGDSGSTFLGFTLACLAVKGNWADQNPIVSFSNPLLIFGVLIYDMIHITIARVATGKVTSIHTWLEYCGKDHLHHRLENALGSRVASVFMIFGLTTCLGLAAIVLRKAGTVEALLLLAQAAIMVAILTVLEQRGRSRKEREHVANFLPDRPARHPSRRRGASVGPWRR